MRQAEGLQAVQEPASAVEGAVFHEDGTLNEEFLGDNFGLGAEEAGQWVVFGSHEGTVAQMLADGQCPVGGIVSTAYKDEGLKGVAKKLNALHDLDPKFSITITAATVEREQVKKK